MIHRYAKILSDRNLMNPDEMGFPQKGEMPDWPERDCRQLPKEEGAKLRKWIISAYQGGQIPHDCLADAVKCEPRPREDLSRERRVRLYGQRGIQVSK